jgi:hypothetical protein
MNTTQFSKKLGFAERRIWSRFPGNGALVTICHDAGQQEAKVLNKSFGGIALAVAESSALSEGQLVAVAYEDVKLSATISRIQRNEKTDHVIALEWLAQQGFLSKILNAVLHRGAADSPDVR